MKAGGYSRKLSTSLTRGKSLISSLKTLSKYSFCATVRWFFQSPATPVQTQKSHRITVFSGYVSGCTTLKSNVL